MFKAAKNFLILKAKVRNPVLLHQANRAHPALNKSPLFFMNKN